MILDITSRVRRMVPDLVGQQSLSVACISRAKTVCLVFAGRSTTPVCVVHVGPASLLERDQERIDALYTMLPQMIARPLAYERINSNTGILIQVGLPGITAARLADHFRSSHQWRRIRQRAFHALLRFHSAVRSNPQWQCSVCPAYELKQIAYYLTERGDLSHACRDRALHASTTLEELGTLPTWWHHGDFCFENMLVDQSSLGLIDFDDFGTSTMPLHDHFALALSVHEHAAAAGPWESLREDLAVGLAAGSLDVKIDPKHYFGLFLYHLLSGIRRRNSMYDRFMALLDQMMCDPESLLPNASPEGVAPAATYETANLQ